MSLLDRLPTQYRRRYYLNVAILIAFVLFFTNVGRLGKQNGATALVWFFSAGLIYLCIWPLVSLIRARPGPPRRAYFFVATWISAFAYVAVSTIVHARGTALALLVGTIVMIATLIGYRTYFFPQMGARITAIRAAQRAEQSKGSAPRQY